MHIRVLGILLAVMLSGCLSGSNGSSIGLEVVAPSTASWDVHVLQGGEVVDRFSLSTDKAHGLREVRSLKDTGPVDIEVLRDGNTIVSASGDPSACVLRVEVSIERNSASIGAHCA